MTAGKQAWPGEAVLARAVSTAQCLLPGLCYPGAGGATKLFLHLHNVLFTNNSANLAAAGCYLSTQTWCSSKKHSPPFFSEEQHRAELEASA